MAWGFVPGWRPGAGGQNRLFRTVAARHRWERAGSQSEGAVSERGYLLEYAAGDTGAAVSTFSSVIIQNTHTATGMAGNVSTDIKGLFFFRRFLQLFEYLSGVFFGNVPNRVIRFMSAHRPVIAIGAAVHGTSGGQSGHISFAQGFRHSG